MAAKRSVQKRKLKLPRPDPHGRVSAGFFTQGTSCATFAPWAVHVPSAVRTGVERRYRRSRPSTRRWIVTGHFWAAFVGRVHPGCFGRFDPDTSQVAGSATGEWGKKCQRVLQPCWLLFCLPARPFGPTTGRNSILALAGMTSTTSIPGPRAHRSKLARHPLGGATGSGGAPHLWSAGIVISGSGPAFPLTLSNGTRGFLN